MVVKVCLSWHSAAQSSPRVSRCDAIARHSYSCAEPGQSDMRVAGLHVNWVGAVQYLHSAHFTVRLWVVSGCRGEGREGCAWYRCFRSRL